MFEIYVVGDSISIQYGPFLEKMLQGLCGYSRKTGEQEALLNLDIPQGANGGDSGMVLEYMKNLVASDWKPDLLVLNCGLHDIKRMRPNEEYQVEAGQYRKNLEAVFQLMKGHGVPVLWVRSTPAITEVHNPRMNAETGFFRYTEDLVEYNRIADEVAEGAGIFVADLYSFTRNIGGNEVFCDHVHFVEKVRELQAAFLSGTILQVKRQLLSK